MPQLVVILLWKTALFWIRPNSGKMVQSKTPTSGDAAFGMLKNRVSSRLEPLYVANCVSLFHTRQAFYRACQAPDVSLLGGKLLLERPAVPATLRLRTLCWMLC